MRRDTFAQRAAALGLEPDEMLRQANEVREEAMRRKTRDSHPCARRCKCPTAYAMCRWAVRSMERIAIEKGYDHRIVEHGGWGNAPQSTLDSWKEQ